MTTKINKKEFLEFLKKGDALMTGVENVVQLDAILPNLAGEFGFVFNSPVAKLVFAVKDKDHTPALLSHLKICIKAHKKAAAFLREQKNLRLRSLEAEYIQNMEKNIEPLSEELMKIRHLKEFALLKEATKIRFAKFYIAFLEEIPEEQKLHLIPEEKTTNENPKD